jgi:hypothetical protein
MKDCHTHNAGRAVSVARGRSDLGPNIPSNGCAFCFIQNRRPQRYTSMGVRAIRFLRTVTPRFSLFFLLIKTMWTLRL